MRTVRIAAIAIFILSLAGIAHAQQAMKGKIDSVEQGTGKLGIVVASVSAEGPPSPTQFKVQDRRDLNSLKPGDQVSFTAQNVDGVLTIEKITKE